MFEAVPGTRRSKNGEEAAQAPTLRLQCWAPGSLPCPPKHVTLHLNLQIIYCPTHCQGQELSKNLYLFFFSKHLAPGVPGPWLFSSDQPQHHVSNRQTIELFLLLWLWPQWNYVWKSSCSEGDAEDSAVLPLPSYRTGTHTVTKAQNSILIVS